jgi:hypothetical protein
MQLTSEGEVYAKANHAVDEPLSLVSLGQCLPIAQRGLAHYLTAPDDARQMLESSTSFNLP